MPYFKTGLRPRHLLSLSVVAFMACVTVEPDEDDDDDDDPDDNQAQVESRCESTCRGQEDAGCGVPNCEEHCIDAERQVPADCKELLAATLECTAEAEFVCRDGAPVAEACEGSVKELAACVGGGASCGECSDADHCIESCICVDGAVEAGECVDGCCTERSASCEDACELYGGWTGD
jgi:hypothetical protein